MRKVILLSLMLIACSEQKIINKAEQRVLLNKKAFNEVGFAWAKLNPVDTTITNIISRSDTLTLTDTFTFHHLDTLNHIDTVFTAIQTVIRIHDTLQKYIQDNRVLNIYKDSIEVYKSNLFVVNSYLSESKKETSKYKWYFYGLLGLIGLILFALIYFKKFI